MQGPFGGDYFGQYQSEAAAAVAYELDAESGSYAVTGVVASLTRGLLLNAAAGVYALTGSASTQLRGLLLSAVSGSYSITGSVATALWNRLLDAVAGVYSLTGSVATLSYGKVLSAVSGVYSLTGQAASLFEVAVYEVNAEPSSYAVSGQSAATFHAHVLSAESGSYAIAGDDAELTYTVDVVLVAASGSYAFIGSPASLTYTPTPAPLSTGDGAYTSSGGWARVLASIRNPLPINWWQRQPWRVQREREQVELQVIVYRHFVISHSGLSPQSLVQQPTTSVYPSVIKAGISLGAKSAIHSPTLSVIYPSLHTKAAHPISILRPPTASLSSLPLITWTDKQYRDDLDDLVALGIIDPDDRDRELLELVGRR